MLSDGATVTLESCGLPLHYLTTSEAPARRRLTVSAAAWTAWILRPAPGTDVVRLESRQRPSHFLAATARHEVRLTEVDGADDSKSGCTGCADWKLLKSGRGTYALCSLMGAQSHPPRFLDACVGGSCPNVALSKEYPEAAGKQWRLLLENDASAGSSSSNWAQEDSTSNPPSKRLCSGADPAALPLPETVLLIRHGEGLHNQTGDSTLPDPELTERGLEQARALGRHPAVTALHADLLVVSPMARAVQTAVAAFGERPPCRVVLSRLHSERWSGPCDQGRPKSALAERFPFVKTWEGFDELKEQWSFTGRSDGDWRERRVPAFRDWLLGRPERRIVVVGHGAFFAELCGRYIGNCEVAELLLPVRFSRP